MMNRYNYEEFFLMYVDNELNAQQRAEVELFAAQNPDLAPELEMLLQTKLPADDAISFDAKGLLLHRTAEINADNYEESFLLYIDNELGDDKKEAVEKFVLQHPELQQSFTLLKQTVLPLETVVFEDKASLLRTTERRVVPLFIRYAAAAAVAGIALMFWWMQHGSTTITSQETANNNQPASTNKSGTTPNIKKDDVATVAELPKQEATTKDAIKPQVAASKTDVAQVNTKQPQVQQTATKQATQQEPIVIQDNDNTALVIPDKTDNITTASVPHNNASDTYSAVSINNSKDEPAANNNYAQTAVYKELDTNEGTDRDALYVGALQINKNKVRGFVKKVGGLFSGKSKAAMANDDGKIQVANLELNPN